MAEGYKDFTAGSQLNAADLEDYCEKQGIMRFASAAAAATALSAVKTEGMTVFLLDVNSFAVYNASAAALSTIGPVHGALTSWTPTLTQSGAVTKTVTGGTYCRVGRMVFAKCLLSITGSGTSSNNIVIGLPVTAADSSSVPAGTGYLIDASANAGAGGFYPGLAVLSSTTTVVLYRTGGSGVTSANSILGVGDFTAALASGDTVAMEVMYEAAADA